MSHFNNQFSSTLAGFVPASGGGTTNFLRADGSWAAAGGSISVSDDNADNTSYYVMFSTASTGNLSAVEVSSAGLRFNPSTGQLTSKKIVLAGTGSPISMPNAEIYAYDTAASWMQISIQNLSSDVSASTDICATADTGTDSANYVDLGINSSTYSVGTWTINGPLDGYLYTPSSHLSIGTGTASKNVTFFTGGTMASNLRLTISDIAITPTVPISLAGNIGITIQNGAPSSTANALYASGGSLYFNGTMLAAGSTVSWGSIIGTLADQTDLNSALNARPVLYSGITTVDFGTAPGNSDAHVDITGQTAILDGSILGTWIIAKTTSDHSVDEHWADDLEVIAGNIVPGTGFTIYAKTNVGRSFGQYSIAWEWHN